MIKAYPILSIDTRKKFVKLFQCL